MSKVDIRVIICFMGLLFPLGLANSQPEQSLCMLIGDKRIHIQTFGPQNNDTVYVWSLRDSITGIIIVEQGLRRFEYTSDSLLFSSYPGFVCTRHLLKKENSRQYIFRISEAITPDRFLVIESNAKATYILGISPPSSATIFGDIDNDGVFEVGGVFAFDTNSKTVVFKIAKNFPPDIPLSTCLSKTRKFHVK